MIDLAAALRHWELDLRQVRERMYRAPTPRERERWHALWRLCQNSDVARIHVFSFPTRTTIFEQCGPSALRLGRIIA